MLIFASTVANAIDSSNLSTDSQNNYSEININDDSLELTDKKLLTAQEKLDEATSKIIKKDQTTDLNSEKFKSINYFKEDKVETCKDLSALKCPELQNQYKNGYQVTTLDIDPNKGQITCAVFQKDKFSDERELKAFKALQKKTFTKKECQEELAYFNNEDTSDDTDNLRSILRSREDEIQNINLKYKFDYKTSGGQKYLDMGDLLDHVITVDSTKINIQKSLNAWELILQNGFTITPNNMVINSFKGSVETLLRYYNGYEISDNNLISEIENKISINNTSSHISNNQVLMFLDFSVNINSVISQASTYAAVLVVFWSVMTWVFNAATNKIGPAQNNENHWGRGIFGVVVFVLLFSNSSEIYTLQNSNDTTEEVQQRIVVKTQRLKFAIRYFYSLFNDLQDEASEIAAKSLLTASKANIGLTSLKRLNHLTAERESLKKENEMFRITYNNICVDTYDIYKLQSLMYQYRKSISSDKNNGALQRDVRWNYDVTNFFGYTSEKEHYGTKKSLSNSRTDFGDLDVNPYPMSEREVYAIAKSANIDLYTIYDPNNVNKRGILYRPFFNFTDEEFFPSLSSCYHNKNKLIENVNRISAINNIIDDLSNENLFNRKLETYKALTDLVYKNQADLGYLSIAFLPALHNHLSITQTNNAESFSEESMVKELATAIPMLALLNGSELAQLYNNLGHATLSTIPSPKPIKLIVDKFFKKQNSAPGLVSYYLAYKTIKALFNSLLVSFPVNIALYALYSLLLIKLLVYIASAFVAVYLLSQNQEQKITAIFGRFLAFSAKGLAYVICIFLAIFIASLLDSVTILNNEFISNLSLFNQNMQTSFADDPIAYAITTIENKILEYSYIALSLIISLVLKLVIYYHVILKLPLNFFEIIESASYSTANTLVENVTDSAKEKGLKGL
jgi:hypothetical protein